MSLKCFAITLLCYQSLSFVIITNDKIKRLFQLEKFCLTSCSLKAQTNKTSLIILFDKKMAIAAAEYLNPLCQIHHGSLVALA